MPLVLSPDGKDLLFVALRKKDTSQSFAGPSFNTKGHRKEDRVAYARSAVRLRMGSYARREPDGIGVIAFYARGFFDNKTYLSWYFSSSSVCCCF